MEFKGPQQLVAPCGGTVHFLVERGQVVAAGQEVAVVETVKLEAVVYAPCRGVIVNLALPDYTPVAGGDYLCDLLPQ